MTKNLVFCIILIFYSTGLFSAPVVQETGKFITLRLPPKDNTMQYVKALLIKAYASIGYQIEWLDIARSQELTLASNAKLSAALARHPVIEETFPRLVQVPFKLFDFKLLKVSDRLRCGYCLNEDIHSIVYTKGARISVNYAQSLRSTMDKLAIHGTENLNKMILKRRVDSMLIMDFQLEEVIAENHHMIVETIAHEYDYHYLSPAYKHLQTPLMLAFEKLEKDGTIARLQQEYNIEVFEDIKKTPENISFIAGSWLDYTNADGSGVYWDIIDRLFDRDFVITKKTSTWARALRAFEQNKIEVLVGAFRKEIIAGALYSSFHIDYEYPLYAFFRNKDVLTRFKAQDKSLSACLNSGASLLKYAEFIKKDNVIETSLKQCELLIAKGKVDVIIEFDYNLSTVTQALPRVELREASPMFLVFHNTPKGHFLKHYFDENISRLARDNVLEKIFPDQITFKQAHIRP